MHRIGIERVCSVLRVRQSVVAAICLSVDLGSDIPLDNPGIFRSNQCVCDSTTQEMLTALRVFEIVQTSLDMLRELLGHCRLACFCPSCRSVTPAQYLRTISGL